MAKYKRKVLTVDRLLTKSDIAQVLDEVRSISSNLDSIIVVALNEAGDIGLYYSSLEDCKLIGLLEMAKHLYLMEGEVE